MMQHAVQQIAAQVPGVSVDVKEQVIESAIELVADAGLIPRSLRVARRSKSAIEVKQGRNVETVTSFEELIEETTFAT